MGKRERQRARKQKKIRQARRPNNQQRQNRDRQASTEQGSKKRQRDTDQKSQGNDYCVKKFIKTKHGKREARVVQYPTSVTDILVLGDGDFSFSVGLVKSRKDECGGIVCTSYDPKKRVLSKYKQAKGNIEHLKKENVETIHQVDATALEKCAKLKDKSFERIVFNFPHTGSQRVHENRALLRDFFKSAEPFLNENGQVHVTLKICKPYVNWDVESRATEGGFALADVLGFDASMFPGYKHRTTDPGHNESNPFSACKTFVFVKKQ